MPNLKDKLPGGLADGENLNQYCKEQLLKGLLVELEHTDDISTALEIVTDHLEESNKYYNHLEDMEKTMDKPSKELSKDAWKRIASDEVGSVESIAQSLMNGENIPVTDKMYDALIDYFNSDDTLYDEYGQYLVSDSYGDVFSKEKWLAYLKTGKESYKMKQAQDQGYNGYTNHETWAVGLWFDNDRGLYEMVQEMIAESGGDSIALADSMQAFVEEMKPELDGVFSDLMDASLSEVNWDELAKTAMGE